MNVKQCQDQRHAHIYAVLNLLEVSGPGIFVDLHGNLVYAGKRMKDIHIVLGPAHEFLIQNIEILQPDVIFFVKEALSLYAGHIEQIQFGDDVFKLDALLVGITFLLEKLSDIVGNTKFRRGDEDEMDMLEIVHLYQ